jgi:hypothetical protein
MYICACFLYRRNDEKRYQPPEQQGIENCFPNGRSYAWAMGLIFFNMVTTYMPSIPQTCGESPIIFPQEYQQGDFGDILKAMLTSNATERPDLNVIRDKFTIAAAASGD